MSLLVLAAAIADLCGAVAERSTPPDPADAAQYAGVGDDARARGDLRVAATAYRKAIAADPDGARARDALAALCATTDDDPLLDAIARFRDGDLDAASRTLATIVAEGGASTSGAHFFLGLIALQRHDGGTATREMEAAHRDPAYRELATPMLRLARREGVVSAVLLVEPEFDSNPQLLPDTPPPGAITGPRHTDADVLLVATMIARPARWLVLRNVFAWRTQRELVALDFIGETGQVTAELDRGAHHLAIRYDLDFDLLDHTPYLFANRGTLSYRRDLGGVALAAGASIRRRAYLQLAQMPFTGWVYAAEAGVVVQLGVHAALDVHALGWREITEDRVFADLAGGGQATLRLRPASRARLAVTAGGWRVQYDLADPDGVLRRDQHGEGSVDLEIDLGDHAIALVGGSVLGNGSTIDDFRYSKVVVRCGLAFAFGAP